MHRLRVLVWKEFLELRQNPRLFGLVIVAPIIQLTLLGYAATTDVRDVPLVVADGDRTAASRELVARFDASRNFTVIDTVTTVAEVGPYLQRGRAWLALSCRPATSVRSPPGSAGAAQRHAAAAVGARRRQAAAVRVDWPGGRAARGRRGVLVRGSLTLLFVLSVLYVVCTLALGLFISSSYAASF